MIATLITIGAILLIFSSGFCACFLLMTETRKADEKYLRDRIREARRQGWESGDQAAVTGLSNMSGNRKNLQTTFGKS